ncbi:type VI secretion system membrane subunit TssM [Stenotrophomonas sp. CD2]|nr:type VI secretion system membrane subunit TssM [Stenotrophomonas sp. CD2]
MQAIMGALRRVNWVVAAGVLLLALLVWFGGPWVAIAGRVPLAGVMARLLVLLVLVLTVLGIVLVRRWRRRRREQRMGEALRQGMTRRNASPASAASLNAASRRRWPCCAGAVGGIGQLPWYLLIGPPGSGKTTLLQNSGLQFPLAARLGNDAVRGVGGTRQCDWWFTDQAVFLDTAGRYTTQDSDRTVDAAGWRDFLQLLRRHRRARPLNGVVVSMSLSDLLQLDAGEREQHARAIRQRLDELAEQLQLQVPVYLVLTKCDLLAGFGEFFDDLGADLRSQVWGTTFPLQKTLDGSAARSFADAYARLLDRLNARVLQRLHDERERGRRAALLAFPPQFAALGESARQFIESAFAGHAYAPAPLLRGCTSLQVRRKARRSTACSVRWHAASAWMQHARLRLRLHHGPSSSSGCCAKWCCPSTDWPASSRRPSAVVGAGTGPPRLPCWWCLQEGWRRWQPATRATVTTCCRRGRRCSSARRRRIRAQRPTCAAIWSGRCSEAGKCRCGDGCCPHAAGAVAHALGPVPGDAVQRTLREAYLRELNATLLLVWPRSCARVLATARPIRSAFTTT